MGRTLPHPLFRINNVQGARKYGMNSPMAHQKHPFRFTGGFLVTLLGATVLLLSSYANGPDRELSLSRVIPSDLTTGHLDRQISSLTRWPQWFYSLKEAKADPSSPAPSLLKKGDVITLAMDPKKGPSKCFSLKAEVTEYRPAHSLSLKIIDDSSHRLTLLFDRLEWKIELEPKPSGGSWIRSTAIAHTHHWRSRLFGAIAEKILMHQVFYPNVLKLATLMQPFSVDSLEAPPLFSR
jgi:hypothetical protein